jgi:tetratricopeptide (TPR) repeat protein
LYDRATQLRLNSKEAWLGRGALAQDAGELEVAASHLSRALGLDPLCWRVGINIGNLAARQGNLTTALRAFSHVIRTNPFIPQAFYSRGFVQVINAPLPYLSASFGFLRNVI